MLGKGEGMLTIKIEINGQLIELFDIINSAQFENGNCGYEYRRYIREYALIKTGTVKHKRADGALELVRKVIIAEKGGRDG